MKTLKLTSFFYLFALLISVQFASAQRLVSASEVTPTFLKETCDNAYLEVLEVKDTYIKIKNTYSVFLDIDESKRFVTLSSVYNLVDGASKKDALELVNKINAEVALIKVYYSESTNTVTYYYYFWTEGGFTQKSLIGALGLYKTALTLSIQKDTAQILK